MAVSPAMLKVEEKSDKTCSDFNPNKNKNQRKDYIIAGYSNDGPFEAIYEGCKPAFIVLNKNGLTVQETVTIGEKTYWAPERKSFPYEPYGFINTTELSTANLYREVLEEFDAFVDTEPIWKQTFASSVLLSYQQSKIQTVPYLFPFGDNESGKTTILNLMNALCYRPLNGITIPTADLFGYLKDNEEPGCIFEDEIQGINKETDKIKIYKSGYKRGAKVPRVKITSNDKFIEYYNTFCLKVCAGEQIPQVKGFRERFIEIPMVEGYPSKEWADIIEDDQKRLQILRNKLLIWKLLTKDQRLPEVNLKFRGRLKEIWKPLLQITAGLPAYSQLLAFISKQASERLEIKQNTLEGHIIKVVVENIPDAKPWPFTSIWQHLQNDLDGRIEEKKPNKMDTDDFGEVTKQKVGYRLREILSAEKKSQREEGKNGKFTKAYQFNLEKLSRIARKYGYEDSANRLSEIVSKCLTLPTSEDKQTIKTPLEVKKDNGKRAPQASQELGKLGHIDTAKKPLFFYKDIPTGEKCEACGEQAVTKEITSPQDETLRRCDNCFNELRKLFSKAIWQADTPAIIEASSIVAVN